MVSIFRTGIYYMFHIHPARYSSSATHAGLLPFQGKLQLELPRMTKTCKARMVLAMVPMALLQ